MNNNKGFVLLYVVAAIGMASAILLPAVSKARKTADAAQVVSNGANIYRAVFASQMNAFVLGEETSSFPAKGQFTTSTEYFKHLVASGVLPVTFDFFAAPGIPPARSSSADDFTADHNAWRMVLGLDDAPEGTPFLFTRNYDPDRLQDGDAPIVLNDAPPFGKSGLVVVQKGGAAFFLKGEQLRNSFFNPAGTVSGSNIVLIGP